MEVGWGRGELSDGGGGGRQGACNWTIMNFINSLVCLTAGRFHVKQTSATARVYCTCKNKQKNNLNTAMI